VTNFIYIDRQQPDYSVPYMGADEFTPANLRKRATR
jgi:hypothetical protein